MVRLCPLGKSGDGGDTVGTEGTEHPGLLERGVQGGGHFLPAGCGRQRGLQVRRSGDMQGHGRGHGGDRRGAAQGCQVLKKAGGTGGPGLPWVGMRHGGQQHPGMRRQRCHPSPGTAGTAICPPEGTRWLPQDGVQPKKKHRLGQSQPGEAARVERSPACAQGEIC